MAVFVRASSSLLNDDLTPAAFWITHPSNRLEHNNVAGGTHFGFWYRMLHHPEGPSHNKNICPRNAEMGIFNNNTGHSLGWYGLWVFEFYHPKVGGCCKCEEPAAAIFDNTKAWNNFRGLEYAECAGCQFHNTISANNFMANIEMLVIYHDAPVFNKEVGNRAHNSVLVSYLNHEDHAPANRLGFVLPFGHGLIIDGVCFDRYDGIKNDDITSTAIGMVEITCVCSEFCGSHKYRFSDVTWGRTTTQKAYTKWHSMWDLEDYDGTLTGVAPRNGKYANVIAMSSLYNPSQCTVSPEWSVHEKDIEQDGAVCEPGPMFAGFAFNQITPESFHFKSITVTNHYKRPLEVLYHGKNSNKMVRGWNVLMELPDPDDFDDVNEYTIEFEMGDAIVNFTYNAKLLHLPVSIPGKKR